MAKRWFVVPALLTLFAGSAWAADCPALLQGSVPKLHAKESIDLCQRFAGKPLVVVNTASFCGFAPQFKGLEALYQRYKEQGLEVVGVPSNDFKQESKDGAETAKVCYVNYGVTFTMTEPQKVLGADAVHLFKVLAQQSSAPKWNFYKYVVDRQGNVIASFSSLTKPDNPEFIEAVEKALASKS
ncbi:redoxin domain-containing protein [Pseudomonas protegens]|uniref:Glutathione peroxidase n=1 Tax=Pseudomonas protegens TaxID=380021 RepID=A0A7G8YKU9_9PSED|nr:MULTISPECIES: redoxin domain-containing protein [Pseudomonas]RBJ79044.1 glutathione peroxidase [Pseudomonas sp. MWU12-2534b]MCO7570948.1 redoxin domain-containing protein [Pseudomonas chlororaphis]MCO7589034.1 redoxin domain-containing protein [Pseudomonas chlororaphis]MCO7612162.1 redoxin domain-containing protein [Pseudomonas chlororaphis]MDF2397241.1 redoxin domain-containing protein [Pseudomonas sp. 3MA1]